MSTTRGKLSPWAVLAIVLSIGLCPFVTAAAILAGLWALRYGHAAQRYRYVVVDRPRS